jgi:hypothetical protein
MAGPADISESRTGDTRGYRNILRVRDVVNAHLPAA